MRFETASGAVVTIAAPARFDFLAAEQLRVIVACMNGGRGSFILRSTSGRPEGPYENIAGNATGPIFNNLGGSLFEDDDGQVYFVGHNHFIARMKADLSGQPAHEQQIDQQIKVGWFMKRPSPAKWPNSLRLGSIYWSG